MSIIVVIYSYYFDEFFIESLQHACCSSEKRTAFHLINYLPDTSPNIIHLGNVLTNLYCCSACLVEKGHWAHSSVYGLVSIRTQPCTHQRISSESGHYGLYLKILI